MTRNKLLEVAFMLDELITKRKKKIIRYSVIDDVLVVRFEDGNMKAYSL